MFIGSVGVSTNAESKVVGKTNIYPTKRLNCYEAKKENPARQARIFADIL